MVNNTCKRKAAATLLISACIGATLYNGLTLFPPSPTNDPHQFIRRSLMSSSEQLYFDEDDAGNIGMYPWAQYHLRPVDVKPDAEKETALFWDIPESGGSTAKAIYKCLGKNIDTRSQIETIEDAANLGLVESNDVDVIFSSFPSEAVGNLFDTSHKGRMLALFRNPVDRLINTFYYLQIATWEKTYRPEWKDMDIMDWVNDVNIDNNHMVKKLAGKSQRDEVTELDFFRAKNTIRQRMIVGLMTDMEESFNRFNKVLNCNEDTELKFNQVLASDVDDTNGRYNFCMDLYFGGSVAKKSNANSYPMIDDRHPAYQVLAEQNSLDLQLYKYILKLFDEQKAIVEGYDTRPEAKVSSFVEEAVVNYIPGTVVSTLAEDLSQYSKFSSEVIVPNE